MGFFVNVESSDWFSWVGEIDYVEVMLTSREVRVTFYIALTSVTLHITNFVRLGSPNHCSDFCSDMWTPDYVDDEGNIIQAQVTSKWFHE